MTDSNTPPNVGQLILKPAAAAKVLGFVAMLKTASRRKKKTPITTFAPPAKSNALFGISADERIEARVLTVSPGKCVACVVTPGDAGTATVRGTPIPVFADTVDDYLIDVLGFPVAGSSWVNCTLDDVQAYNILRNRNTISTRRAA